MKKLLYYLSAATLLLTACSDQDEISQSNTAEDECLTTAALKTTGQIIEGEYIVTTTDDEGGRAASVESYLNGRKAAILEKIELEKSYFHVRVSEEEAGRMRTQPGLVIEPDRVISICACFTVQEPRSVTWNIDKVGYGDGRGKTAWIIDTGIDFNHPDLSVDAARSKSFMADNVSFDDDNGHGTHVAGIIGALNNHVGTLGVASGASLVALKVLDEKGDGKLSGLMSALSAVRKNGKAGDVVNISIGFTEASTILENEIKAIAAKGIYFALAAGNESMAANSYSPAQIGGTNIYTVSAVDSLDRFASFSNYGNDVIDFAAPGVRILSSYTEGRYAILSGTSMAAPHVAGLLLINKGKVNSRGTATSDPDGIGDPLAHK